MTRTLLVAAREFREKSRLFLLAAVLSVMPFIALLLPNMGNDRMAAVGMLSTFIALALAFGLAAILGASTIGRELTERRLSFYFSRPLSAAAIWSGKALASIVTALLAFVIVLIPGSLVFVPQFKQMKMFELAKGLGFIAVVVLALFLLSHLMSTMVRSRSALGALDVALIFGTGYALTAIIRPAAVGLQSDVFWIIAPVVALLAIVLAVAPVYQLERGRTDARRSHVALSIALWTGVAAVVLLTFLGVLWLRGADPLDYDKIETIQQAPNSPWMFIVGSDRTRFNYKSSYLVNTETGERERLNGFPWSSVQFSRDGRVAAWLQPYEVYVHEFELYVRSLDKDGQTIATGIRMPAPYRYELSADGSRLAVALNGLITVYDVQSRKVLASVRSNAETLYFLNNDVLRVIDMHIPKRGDGTLAIRELDIPSKKIVTTGGTMVPRSAAAVSVNADGSRMLVRGTALVLDGRTAETLVTLPEASKWYGTAMLPDGGIVDVTRVNKELHLKTYTADGKPVHDLPLAATHGWLLGHIGGKRLVLETSKKPQMSITVIDLERGAIVHNAPAKAPVMMYRSAYLPDVGTAHALATLDANEKLALWDPGSGAMKEFPR